ncbi:efflux RND transporter periplasmic adaptor subunit [Celeribacter indicus]|uniref:RND family efflux transporter MFP subunit n=1 Tax=Celeribacter indicus TaxID=1208324 RepID=A0A0B5E6K9_9RHOB|nr:efflux RND transporter periplasmic adaptor subunit [Celeribacter indicus]AJE48631.1 RND family efflux transporter MFP subunit [Celeribacter indicus]SDX51201.1 HlyD family secretion protein [Celeribacter indicus]
MGRSTAEISETLQKARQRRHPLRIVIVLAILAAVGGWIWLGTSRSEDSLRYVTEPVRRGSFQVDVTATGTVQPTTKVTVSSELSGTLSSVEVDYNDRVSVGQVLARLDDTKLRAQVTNAEASLAAAKARLTQAEATAREAQSNYDTQRHLDQRGVTARTGLITFEAAHERAQAAVDLAAADLKLAEANLLLAQADLEDAAIVSPIDGIVLDRVAEVGLTVAASLSAPELFTLAEDLRQMEVQVDIDEADIGRVSEGNAATFTVDAYSGRRFEAQLAQLRYASEETDGVVTYKGVLTVDNEELLLRPGMTATATIVVAQVEDALVVSNSALRYVPPQQAPDGDGGGGSGLLGLLMPSRDGLGAGGPADASSVWVLRGGAATEIAVVTGESDGRSTEIRSGDLAEGDLVIIDQTEAP